MELHWTHANSGKHGAAGEGFSIGDSRSVLQNNPGDDFQCTYFRQRINRSPTTAKKGGNLFPVKSHYTSPSDVSDGYTDSDSESESTSNVERWLESLPANNAWSSAPNYSALDGSGGLEGVDEIQEDAKKSVEGDVIACANNAENTVKTSTSKSRDSKFEKTADDLGKRVFARRDQISIIPDLRDQEIPQEQIQVTVKIRQKIPVWTKLRREAGTVLENKKLPEKQIDEKIDASTLSGSTLVPGSQGISENHIFIDKQSNTSWSSNDTLKATEERTEIKQKTLEDDGYDDLMQEMVNRLLTASTSSCKKESLVEQTLARPELSSFSRIFEDSKDSRENFEDGVSQQGVKDSRSSATFTNLSPKVAKTKINDNEQVWQKRTRQRTTKRKANAQKKNLKRAKRTAQTKQAHVTMFRITPTRKSVVKNLPEAREIRPPKAPRLSRTVRFQDEITAYSSGESWRKSATAKAARNKRILQKIEQIVEDIGSGGFIQGEKNAGTELDDNRRPTQISISETEPEDASESKHSGSRIKSDFQGPMPLIEKQKIENKKPMFSNRFIEECLDRAMEVALNKYKRPANTWENFIKQKTRGIISSFPYEPPAKKQKPESFNSNIENISREDFSKLNSWQSVHKYLLLYSSFSPWKIHSDAKMQCNAPETPENSQVQDLILRTEKNGMESSMEIANTPLRGYITDPGLAQNVAGPKKARWQVTVTSDDCALKKHFQGWQVCTKVQADDYNSDNQTSKETKSSDESATTPFTTKLHATTSYDYRDLEEIEKDEEPGHGSILLKEYLKLLTNGDARINFIIRVLSQAIHNRGLEHIERLLRHNVADFVWYTTKHSPAIRPEDRTLINKFSGCYFTSKVDMCNNLENVYWFYESGISNIQFPRCYNIYQPSQVSDFKADYRITACLGILKWFLGFAKTAGPEATWSENGNIPINAILFALERCTEFISVYTHEDIDREDYKEVSIVVWDEFLDWYYSIMHGDGVLRRNSKVKINELVVFAENILTAASKYRYLQGDLDGIRDIWILKPGDKSLGRGIVLMDRLPDILNKITQTAKEGMQYVVQKYIERPLLVYNKKIDVRQWFLITSTHPLIVWMYSDILIRFASRDFTLNDFHESIHLCNTMVQIKYRKNHQKDSMVPEELHWNLQDFKDYLKGLNQESAWDKIIRPGIRQNLTGALLASQNNMMNRKNSFQLYGADFVIMDDFSVWLIEINTNPRLHPPSSIVTSKLYPEVIEDTIKIVIDRRRNKRASYGKFTCIFKQKNPICGTNSLGQGTSLGIRGHSVFQTNKTVGNLRVNTTPSLY